MAGGRLYQQIEIEHGPFRRLVELGAEVVAEEARASYEDGFLQVEIPLARPDTAVRRVPIEESAEEGIGAPPAEPGASAGDTPGTPG